VLNLNEGDFKEIMDLILAIKEEFNKWRELTAEILRSYLQIFLVKCKQFYLTYFAEKKKTQDPHFALVQHFIGLVEKKFQQIHLVQDYADMIGLSPAALNKYVKKITGNTAGEIILDRLMLQAKRYLIYTDLSNKEIAYQLSYDDPSYFSRIFKKKTGLTPSGFRRSENEKYQH